MPFQSNTCLILKFDNTYLISDEKRAAMVADPFFVSFIIKIRRDIRYVTPTVNDTDNRNKSK